MKTDFQKLFRLKDGRLAAIAGTAHCTLGAIAWLDGKRETPPSGDYSILVIMLDGVARLYEDGADYLIVEAPFARGTGGCIAGTAMLCGKTAVEAVKLACQLDIYSGGAVKTMQLRKPRKK